MDDADRTDIEREIADAQANADHENLEPAEVDEQILDEELAEDREASERAEEEA